MKAILSVIASVAALAIVVLMVRVSQDQSTILGILSEGTHARRRVEISMSTLCDEFWYVGPGEVCVKRQVCDTQNTGETYDQFVQRHNANVEAAQKGLTLKNPPSGG